MKRIVVFIVLLLLFPAIAKAETFYSGNDVKDVPLYLDKISKQSYRYFKTAYRRSDNVLVYCVEPSKLLSVVDNYFYIEKNQEKYLGITESEWRRIELLSYFGYGYANHNEEKWAAITQYLIWQTVLPEGWYLTFTDGYGGEFKNVHQEYTNEIEALIKNFETTPSFENEKYKITKNDTLVLKDKNNILNNYRLESNVDLNVSIKDNELHIEGTKNGDYHLEFVRGEYIPTKLYISENNQSVVSTEGVPEKRFSIDIIVESGNIKIKRLTDDYLENEGTNENAVYEITDSHNNSQIISTDKNGEIILKDLPIGNLVIKELNPSVGYEKDINEYEVLIKNNEELILEINPNLIKKKLNIIKKYLVEEENLLPNEKDSFFSVLKNSQSKLISKTNTEGLISFVIPYGHYTIIQNSTILGYELMQDYDIFVEDSSEETLVFVNYKKEEKIEIPDITPPEIEEEDDIVQDNTEDIDNVTQNNKEEDNIIEEVNKEIEEDIIEEIPEEIIEDNQIITNPKTGDNIMMYLWFLIVSGTILSKILIKMQ